MLDEYDGEVWEAWHTGGKRFWHGSVRRIESPYDGHSPGTPIDVFTVDGDYDEAAIRAFCHSQDGKHYAFRDVAKFLTRTDASDDDNEKWFCSELVLAAVARGGLELLKGTYAHMSPRDVSISPHLTYEKTI
jgi:hypothetical protein